MKKLPDLTVGIGEVLWDMLPSGRRLGGAPANFAYHVSQFGLPAMAVSAVGNDGLGVEIRELFTSKGMEFTLATVPYHTGTVDVVLDGNGVPCYDIKENVAWDNIPFTPELEQVARRTRALCFGSLAQRSEASRLAIDRFIKAMPRTSDSMVVFDANLRQHFYTPEILIGSMQLCDVLKINDEELDMLTRMLDIKGQDLTARCHELMRLHSLRMLILTCGTHGSYVFGHGTEISFIPTPEVKVADTAI